MTVSSPKALLSSIFKLYHGLLPRSTDYKRPYNDIHAKKTPWTSIVAAGLLGILLIVLVMYQTKISDTTGKGKMKMPFVRSLAFNCSDLGLHSQRVEEKQQYHIFPTDVELRQTCQSKYQQHCFRKNSSPKFFPPPKFLSVLRDYEAYHARCTRGNNLTRMALEGEVPANCKYLVWKAMDGMGNQLISIVSAFIYSLLTKRAMLIATDSHVEKHLCNPFPLSSWELPHDFPEPKLRTNAKRLFVYVKEVLEKHERSCSVSNNLPQLVADAPKQLQVYIMCCDQGRDHQFFCPTTQRLLSGVNWLFYHSHEYTLPAFYFVPEFQTTLNDWFPKHDVFMHGARYILNPENELWFRIAKEYKEHMDGSHRQIGIQPRSWRGDYQPTVSRQILRCAIEKELLPRPLPQIVNSSGPVKTKTKPREIAVQVASLRAEYYQNLLSEFSNHSNSLNSSISVFATSNEGVQKTGDLDHDAKAIIDIWLLSFAHDLVITPFSTFGSSASGLAGVKPLLFNNYGNEILSEPACGRTNLVGPCFIKYPKNQPCDLDPARSSIFDPGLMVPEAKYCDFNPGLGVLFAG